MRKVTRTEVDIHDIFSFAKEKFGKEWNDCCEIFQRTEVLPFIGHREFYLEELKYDVEDLVKRNGDENIRLAEEILVAFMEQNSLETMYYVGNSN